jgi:hypothetical protein
MAIDQIKQSIDSQINSVVSSSPVATPPVVEVPKAVVPAEAPSVSPEGSDAGGEYGAVRRDSFTPSAQLSTGVNLSNDPRDVYTGGIVEAGRDAYADLPDSSDDFYLKVKYAPVKQYPLRMPDGNVYDVTTSDFRKAMWQFYMDKMGVPADADWFGYYYVPEQVRETFVGSMLRAIPNTATALGSDLVGAVLRAPANAFEAMGITPETSAAYDEIIKDIFDNVKDTLHVGDVTEETANRYGSMTGSALFTVGAAILSGGSSVAVNTLAAAEAASAYNGIYDSLKNAGYSPSSAFAMSVGGGLGVGLLSRVGNVGEKAMRAAAGAGRGLVYAALKNPGELSRMAKLAVPYHALAEAITEPLQSELENFMSSGMSMESLGENFDERLFEFFSALAIGAGAAYYNSTKMPAYEDRVRSYANEMRATLERIQKALPNSSKGIITDEVLADLITVVNKPEFGRVAYEMMRESIYGQFDKVPASAKQKMAKTLAKLDSVAALENEYKVLESNLDKLFAGTNLPAEVESEVRMLLRAVASWNLVHRGVLPSKFKLPAKISYEPTRTVKNMSPEKARNVAGHTLGDVIFLNPMVPSTPMVDRVPSSKVSGESGKMSTSRRVLSEVSGTAKGNPNVDQTRRADVAYMRHEVAHWIERRSGLKNVPKFMSAFKRIANSVVPNFTKGKTGTELSEAYAVGLQYAAQKAAEEIGLEGPVGDYIDFMHTMLYAQERAQGLQKDVQAYVDVLRATMKQNAAFIDEMIKGFGSEKLRGAIKEFIKTGDSSLLDAETIKGLNAVLQGVADAQTQDNLQTMFDSPNQMKDFSRAVANMHRVTANKKVAEMQARRDEAVAKADKIVGIATPEDASPIDSAEAAFTIGISDKEEEAKAPVVEDGKPEVKAEEPAADSTGSENIETKEESGKIKDYSTSEDAELLRFRLLFPAVLQADDVTALGKPLNVTIPGDEETGKVFKVKAADRKNAERRAKWRRNIERRIDAVEKAGKERGLFSVFDSNDLWTPEYETYLANKVAGFIEGEKASKTEAELYRIMREYSLANERLTSGWTTEDSSPAYIPLDRVKGSDEEEARRSKRIKDKTQMRASLYVGEVVPFISRNADYNLAKAELLSDMLSQLKALESSGDSLTEAFIFGMRPELVEQYTSQIEVNGRLSAMRYDARYKQLSEGLIARTESKIAYFQRKAAAQLIEGQMGEDTVESARRDINSTKQALVSQSLWLERLESSVEAAELNGLAENDVVLVTDYTTGQGITLKEAKDQVLKYSKSVSKLEGDVRRKEALIKEYRPASRSTAEPDEGSPDVDVKPEGFVPKHISDMEQSLAAANARIRQSERKDGKPTLSLKEIDYVDGDGNVIPMSQIEATVNSFYKKLVVDADNSLEDMARVLHRREAMIDARNSVIYAGNTLKYAIDADNSGSTPYTRRNLAIAQEQYDSAWNYMNRLALRNWDYVEPSGRALLPKINKSSGENVSESIPRGESQTAVGSLLNSKAYNPDYFLPQMRRYSIVAPSVQFPSIAEFFKPKSGQDYLSEGLVEKDVWEKAKSKNYPEGSSEAEAMKQLSSDFARLSPFGSPRVHQFTTDPTSIPTPLESKGVTLEEAISKLEALGEDIPQFDLTKLNNEAISRYYDDGIMTFTRVWKALLDQIPSEAGSTDRNARFRELVVIDMAKQLARERLGEYYSREMKFREDPTLGTGITPHAVAFDKSKKGSSVKKANAKEGYTFPLAADVLPVGAQIAFAKGNKIERAVVTGRYELDNGKITYSLYRDIDLDSLGVDFAKLSWDLDLFSWASVLKNKDVLASMGRKMEEWVISSDQMSKVEIFGKKPAERHVRQLMKAYSKFYSIVGRPNITELMAQVWAAHQEDNSISAQVQRYLSENAESVAIEEGNIPTNDEDGDFAVFDAPVSEPKYDPGLFSVFMGNGFQDATLSELFQAQLNSEQLNELLPEDMRQDFGTVEDMLALMARDSDERSRAEAVSAAMRGLEDYYRRKKMPTFTSVVSERKEGQKESLQQQMLDLRDGFAATKTYRPLYSMAAGSSLDRKLIMLAGEEAVNGAFDFIGAASDLQQLKEEQINAAVSIAVNEVFSGNRVDFDKWRGSLKADLIEGEIDGATRKISEGEVMSLYAMKRQSDAEEASHAKVVEEYEADPVHAKTVPLSMEEFKNRNSQFKRAARRYGGEEGATALISKLSDKSKGFVDIVGPTVLRHVSKNPDWIPSVAFDSYSRSSWESRRHNKLEYTPTFELVRGDSDLAALDYYDSLMSAISSFALDGSGLKVQLQNLQKAFDFQSFDLSKVAPLTDAEQEVYRSMLEMSKQLREELVKKIGVNQANWFIKNIENDLSGSALSGDIAQTPEAKMFSRLSRASGASVLMLNVKQFVQGLGNYHRLLGLSKHGALKYYTTDWFNAVAHTREAWALMKQNPELLRRLRQSGISEHTMRLVDENADSLFSEFQQELLNHGKNKSANVVSLLNTLSNKGTKYGLMPNVIGDMLGLAWANYVVRDDVRSSVEAREVDRLRKLYRGMNDKINSEIDAMTDKEIANFVNSHVSSSNYMAKSFMTKWLNKAGLGAFVMFTNDQLQSFGSLAQAIQTWLNGVSPEATARAKKDIIAWVASTIRFVAIKAGWYSALASLALGGELSDDDVDRMWDASMAETINQLGGWHQLGNIGFTPVIRAVIDGERLGPSIVPVSAAGRAISAGRKGEWWDFAKELSGMSVAPVIPGLSRVVEGVMKMSSDNEHEQRVGSRMVMGTSETGAMKELGLSKSKKTGKIQPKKKLKKDGE